MKLTKVRITDFQSVRDSTEFDIGDATCLVGKNESGKTALLQAMYKIRPIVDTDVGYNVTDDYPRRDVSDYEHDIEKEEREHAVVGCLTYELDEADVAAVAKIFGTKALTSRTLTISKAYEQPGITFNLSINPKAALQYLLSRYSVTSEIRNALRACSTPAAAQEVVADLEQTEAIQNITQWLDIIASAGSVNAATSAKRSSAPVFRNLCTSTSTTRCAVVTASTRSSSETQPGRLRNRITP